MNYLSQLDTGSNSSFISKRLVTLLNLKEFERETKYLNTINSINKPFDVSKTTAETVSTTPLKISYYRACDDWMAVNPGKAISEYEVAEIFQKAYARSAIIQNGLSGFKVAGIWPFNSQIFNH